MWGVSDLTKYIIATIDISKKWFKKLDIQTNLDDISVDIGRDGQLLIVHGKHRLSIVKLLDIPKKRIWHRTILLTPDLLLV